MSTRAEIRSLVRSELKIDPNWKIWNDSTLNSYINRAYLQIQKDWNLDWQENDANTTYTATAQETALPSDFWKVVLVRYNWSELYWTTKVILKREITTFQSWTPSRYYLYSNTLGTDTIPSSWTIDLDYKKIIAGFTADADNSAYPANFDTAIVKYSTYLAWSTIWWRENKAAWKLSEYRIEKDTLISTYIFIDVNNLVFNSPRRWWVSWDQVLDRNYHR